MIATINVSVQQDQEANKNIQFIQHTKQKMPTKQASAYIEIQPIMLSCRIFPRLSIQVNLCFRKT